ncbi:MAG: electron transfer flavoprotein subunit alpha/FixB family protein [Syntrophobacteraceae bacterium]
MKTLLIEALDQAKIAELVTASKIFGESRDIVALGDGDIPGTYGKAYLSKDAVAANVVTALVDLIKNENYEVILLSASTVGNGLAGPLAAKLSAGFVSEVTAISPDLVIERPVYGGKALAKYKVAKSPMILTLRRNCFEKDPLEGKTAGVPLAGTTADVALLAEYEEKGEGVPLEDAQYVVSGGRGMGAAENFVMLKELADLLKGAVGASRGAVDEGWISPQSQVGQTGKIVAPQVYFAVGISGASQHIAGIANAKCVVGINKDEEASIFKRARFGIVADYKKVIPEIINTLKAEL